jgi:hypothetical protein
MLQNKLHTLLWSELGVLKYVCGIPNTQRDSICRYSFGQVIKVK